ncbi:MAG: autotransporter outer membrane beta-barrel domain-containing protein [Gammaproteobacteria bacterium]|jgi:uncharacterized protein YhjY with autotransporter beta-barrel domain
MVPSFESGMAWGVSDCVDRTLLKLGSGLCAAFLLFSVSTANADCQPQGSQKPDDILCTDADDDGVASAGGDDTVTVLSNATITVQGVAPTTSVTAIDAGNGNDTVINFGSVFAGLAGETDSVVSTVNVPVLSVQTNDPWNRLLATGINLGNGEDHVSNHGSLEVESVLNSAVQPQITTTTSSRQEPQPLVTEIAALGIAGGNSGDVIENTGQLTVTATDNTGANAATAVGINSGNGKDIITNTGTITVTATAGQPAIQPQASATTVTSAKKEPQPSGKLTAVGIDAGNAKDAVVTNTGSLVVESATDGGVPQATAQGILAGNGKDVIFSDGDISVTSKAAQSDSSTTATLTGGDDLIATTALDASAIGIDSGNGGDIITNDGSILSEALATLSSVNVELNLVDTSHADTSVALDSNATGIVSGNAKDTVTNTGTIDANATSHLSSINVEVNGADAGLADSTNILDSSATALMTGGGNDTIATTGAINASATSQMNEVGVNVSYADVTIADREGSDTSTKLYSSATGIDSGSGSDNIYIDTPGSVNATALSDVYSVGVSIASEGVPAATESLFIDGSLANVGLESDSDTAAIVTGQGNDELFNFGNVTSNATSNSTQTGVNVGIALIDFVVPTPGLVLGGGGTSADAASVGYDSGKGNDVIHNASVLDIDAESDADSTIVSVNIAEFSIGGIDDFPGLGGAVVAADTTTNATSSADGIVAGDGHDVIDNTGTIDVYADAHGSSTSASGGLGIQVKEGDDALQIDAVLARAETQSDAAASGINGDDGKDYITNSSAMNIDSLAETDALGIGIDITGTLQASGGAIGATLTDTSSTSTARTVGINGGNDNDTIMNSGTMDVDATADTNNINATVTTGYVQKGLVAGAALGRSETDGIASAIGIDGGAGKDQITNNGTVDVKATSDVDSVAVSVTIGGTSEGLAAGAALADGGATAVANATGIRSGDVSDDESANGGCQQQQQTSTSSGCQSANDPDKATAEIVNNSAIIVDAEANTHSTVISADVQIAQQGAALGAALADNSAYATAAALGIEADDRENVLLNAGDVTLKSDASAQAVSIGVDVQGTAEGLAAGAALTNASVTSNALATGIQAGDGDDVVLNTGTIQSGNETQRQVESTATAVGVSTSVLVAGEGAALGAALADTDAKAITNLTAIDGEQGDDELVNQGSIDLQNVGANADAVSVSVGVALSGSGLAGGGAVANSDSTAELTVNGLVGADGKDLLVNETNIDLHNMTADADAVSVSLAVTGAEAGVTLSGALVDADATATANATGLNGGDDKDQLSNKGSINIDGIHANTDAVGVSAGFSFAGEGVAASAALARSGATSNANATGLDGGAANDKLINDGAVTLSNIDADSDAVSVAIGGSGTAAGVALSAGLTDASGKANTNVTGMDGGSGNDYLLNNNAITVTDVDSDAHATGISVTAQFSASGVAGGLSLANTSGIANTRVTGMDGGEGDDRISNLGIIALDGTATADALSVALNITASVGVGGGAAITDASSIAQSTVSGIDGGAGLDDIANAGDIEVTSNAVTESTAASVGITVAVGGDVTLADAKSTATATAVGIYDPAQTAVLTHHASDNGQQPLNELTNLGNITSGATADSEGLAISGNLLGYALGETTNTSTADAAGIRFYQGPALIYNEGVITANSSSTAQGLSVAVTLGGAAVGDTSTTANAYASGIESGAGDDKVANATEQEAPAIDLDARSYASGESIAVGLIGVAEADTTNTANANAKGIDTGAGDDVVLNDARMNISAGDPSKADGSGNCTEAAGGACAKSFAVSATLAGYGTADASSIANANALGIVAGEGDDIVHSNEAVTVTSLARGKAEGISVTLFGASDAAANTTANAGAGGFSGDAGEDELVNTGNLNVATGAETWAKSLSVTIAGDAGASADTTTNATGVGIDGGADNDLIVNADTGSIDVNAKTQSTANASSWNFAGNASAAATLGALTDSYGLLGGSGDDHIVNAGDLNVGTQSWLTAYGSGENIFGNAEAGAKITANALAIGIDSGADNDVVKNSGHLNVDAYANMSADTTAASFAGSAATSEFITAEAHATAIANGSGSITVYNAGEANANVSAEARTQGAASAELAGGTEASGTVATDVSVAGIGGVEGAGTVVNEGDITASAAGQAWATHSSEAGVFFSDGGVVALSSAHLSADGIALGDGDNVIENYGNIEVQLSTGSGDYGNDGSTEGIYARARAEGGDFDIFTGNGDASGKVDASGDAAMYGIRLGDGDNNILNDGRIDVSTSAEDGVKVTAFADPNGGGVTIDGDGWGEGYTTLNLDARGILSGDGQFQMINNGEIDVTVAPQAYSGVDADGGSSGDTDVFVDARVTSDAYGISAGEGEHWFSNSGSIIVSNTASASVNGNANGNGIDGDGRVGYGIDLSQKPGYARVDATTAGIDLGAGASTLIQEGTIDLYDETSSNARAVADSDFTGSANGFARSEMDSSIYALRTRGAQSSVDNSGDIYIYSSPGSSSYADGDADGNGSRAWGTALALTQFDSTVHGILTEGDNSYVLNTGTITINANPDMKSKTDAESNLDGDSNSRAKAVVDLTVAGIETLGAGSVVEQQGDIAINITSTASATSWSRADGALADTRARADSTAIVDARGVGVHVAEGIGTLHNDGNIEILTTVNTATSTDTEAPGLPKGAENNWSLATADAFGLWAGAAQTSLAIINAGNITVDASGTAQISTVGSTYMHTETRAISHAYGIYAIDEADFNVVNTGIISATASATSYRHDQGLLPIADAIGIKTGPGNDTIINQGTIDTSRTTNGVTTLGTAIDSGGGNDEVILGDGSVTNGDIDLGTGTDTLSMEGTPVINGNIIDDMSSLMLSFNNSGSYSGELPGLRAEKNGEGTFVLSTLPQVDYLAVNKGTLQLNRDYVFQDKGDFQATVYGDGSNGQFLVNGTASLSGQMKVVRGNGAYLDGATYDILNATNGIEQGTDFTAIKLPEDKPLLKFQLHELDDKVQVQADVASFTTVARTGNEMAVARQLDTILPSVKGDLNNAIGEVQVLSQNDEFADAFYGLSPAAHDHLTLGTFASAQQYTNTVTARMNNLQFSELVGPTRRLNEGKYKLAANGIAPQSLFVRSGSDYKYGGYVRAFGQRGEQDATADNVGYDFTVHGFTVGMDNKFDNRYIGGASIGYASNDLNADGDSSSGDIQSTMISVYGSYLFNKGYIDAVFSYGRNNYDTRRDVVIGPSTTRLTSSHNGDLLSLAVSGGMYYETGNWWTRPFASLQYTHLDEDGFTETGGATSLNVSSRTTGALLSQLGVSFLRDYKTQSGYLTPEFSIAWIHDYDIDDPTINASYVGAPDATFSIEGQKVEQNGIIAGAGFSYETRSGYITTLKVHSEYRDNYSANTIMGEFRYQF